MEKFVAVKDEILSNWPGEYFNYWIDDSYYKLDKFGGSDSRTFKDFFKQFILLVISSIIIAFTINCLNVNSLILKVIINLFLALIVPTLLIIVFYGRTEPFNQAKERIFMVFDKVKLKKARM